jgi:hypothetical protein
MRARGTFTLPVLFLLLLQTGRLSCQAGPNLDVLVGFNGLFKPGCWTPLRITVENAGSPIQGRLQVEIGQYDPLQGQGENQSGGKRVLYVRDVELPRNSRKYFSFVVVLQSEFDTCKVSIHGAGGLVLKEEVNLRGRAVRGSIVLGLSRQLSLDFLAVLMRAEAEGAGGLRVIYPRIEFLPERWYGYDGVEMVIVHDLRHFSSNQIEALNRWVWSGGLLVIAGGARMSLQEAERISSLLPVEVRGLVELKDFSSLISRFGGGAETESPYLVTDSRAVSGKILAQQEGVPLLVQQTRGSGAVVFMAFDFNRSPFYQWPGKYSLWRSLLRLALQADSAERDRFLVVPEREEMHGLVHRGRFAFPSIWIVIAFVSVYLAALFSVLRLRVISSSGALPPGVRLAAVALLTLLTATGGYILFHLRLTRTENIALDVSLVETRPGQSYARLERNIWLHSLRTKDYPVAVAELKSTAVLSSVKEMRLLESGSPAAVRLPVTRWSDELLRLYSIIPFTVEGGLRQEGNLLRLRLQNTSGQTLKDCLFLYGEAPYFVGDVRQAEPLEEAFRIGGAVRIPEEQIDWSQFIDSKEEDFELRRELLRGTIDRFKPTGENSICLFGWLEHPAERSPLGVALGDDFLHHRKLALLAVVFNLEEKVYAQR